MTLLSLKDVRKRYELLACSVVTVLSSGCRSSRVESVPPPHLDPVGTSQGATHAAERSESESVRERERIERAEAIGRQLYLLDDAAARATDALFAEIGGPEGEDLAGYVAYREGDEEGRPKDSWIVDFYTSDELPRVAHQLRVFEESDREAEHEEFDPPKSASEGLSLLIRAREAALAAIPDGQQPINTVILPGEAIGGDGILVYLLAGTAEPDTAVLGMHHVALVRPDGREVREIRALSGSILEIPTRDTEGREPEALAVTHSITDEPTEIHVFTSLLHGLRIYVGTKSGNWIVDGDRITRAGEDPVE